MTDEITRQRREYLTESLKLAPDKVYRIMEATECMFHMPHEWVPDGAGSQRCVECELTYVEAYTHWPGDGMMPCLCTVLRS